VVKGFNSDVTAQGQTYHVQTEDWGFSNPFVVSRVFLHGAVVKSIKTPYQQIHSDVRRLDSATITHALREQHQKILDLLVSGQL
jgi:hypothetical protein